MLVVSPLPKVDVGELWFSWHIFEGMNPAHSALWVKSGNRGNLKCLKLDDHFALIFHQQMFISFLSDAKLPKVYDRYLGLVIYVKYLMSYLQKTPRGGQGSLKFCVLAN